MERSGCAFLRPVADENAAILYKEHDGIMTGSRNYHDNAFVLNGAGAMKSTLADMKNYVCMYLNYGKTGEERILSREGIRAMCRPRIGYRPESHYCFGLSEKKLDDLTVIEHGGSLPGVSSNLSWSYDAGVGVIVLCNTSGVPVSTIADAAMRMYHGRNLIDDRSYYQETFWDEKKRQQFCGIFQSGEGNKIEIFEKDGMIAAKEGEKQLNFVPVQEFLGIVRNPDKDAYVKFFEDDNEKIFAVGYGGRMLPRVK